MNKNDDGWVINGTKKYVMFGDSSDYLSVLVKEGESFKFVLINQDDKGVTITETTSLDQTRPMCEVDFKDVQIDQKNIMIELDDELSQWNKVKNIALAFLSMEQVGGAQACLDMSTEYAKERIQFGRPIGSFLSLIHI